VIDQSINVFYFILFYFSSKPYNYLVTNIAGDGYVKCSIGGISSSSAAEKVWLVSQALGDIAFAYPYSLILIEIQVWHFKVSFMSIGDHCNSFSKSIFFFFDDKFAKTYMKDTLKSPPPENQTMKKASTIAITVTAFFYLCCGGFGYAAFGDATPGNLLTGFGFYEPYWLIDFANVCVVLHLVGGYQVRTSIISCICHIYIFFFLLHFNVTNLDYHDITLPYGW
jgi:hypothetical protein